MSFCSLESMGIILPSVLSSNSVKTENFDVSPKIVEKVAILEGEISSLWNEVNKSNKKQAALQVQVDKAIVQSEKLENLQAEIEKVISEILGKKKPIEKQDEEIREQQKRISGQQERLSKQREEIREQHEEIRELIECQKNERIIISEGFHQLEEEQDKMHEKFRLERKEMRRELDELSQKVEKLLQEIKEKKNRESELLNITETYMQEEVKEPEESIISQHRSIPEKPEEEKNGQTLLEESLIQNAIHNLKHPKIEQEKEASANCCDLFSNKLIETFEKNKNNESNTCVDSVGEEFTEILRQNEQKSKMKAIVLLGTKMLNMTSFFFAGAVLLGMLVIRTIFLIVNKVYSVTINREEKTF